LRNLRVSATAFLAIGFLLPVATIAQQPERLACDRTEFEDARLVFHRAWFEQADEQFARYLAKCEGDALGHAYVAIIDMLLYRDNAANVGRALDLADTVDDTEGLFVRALANFAQGRLEETESQLRQYLRAASDDNYAAHVLGFTLNDQGNHHEGAQVLTRVLASDPTYFPAKNHLAYALLETGESEDALRVVREFVDADPANPSAWDTQADILHSLDRSEAAIASLSRSLVLDERFAYGYRHLGDILMSVGDDDAAIAAYRKAIRSAGVYGPDFVTSIETVLSENNED
jgi:tetratricopeptide (TPR) repeat protein